MSSTFNLQSTVNWALPFLNYKPVNQGINNEPSISNANIVLQTILGPPFAWRWNRAVVQYNVASAQQDFPSTSQLAATWQQNHVYALDTVIVDANGNLQQVTANGTSKANPHPVWSTTPMATTTDNTVTWTMVNPTDYGFIEKASTNASAATPFELEIRNILGAGTDSGRPQTISPQFDNGAGIITFRTLPVADAVYTVSITYQKKANLFQSLSSTWSPIPDEFSYIYNNGFLALSMAYSDDPRFPIMNNKFMSALLGASEGLDEMQKNLFVSNWMALTEQAMTNQIRTQLGNEARTR